MTILYPPPSSPPQLWEVSLGNYPKCNSQAHGVESKQKGRNKKEIKKTNNHLKWQQSMGIGVATIYKDSTSEPNLEPGFEPWSCQHWTKPG
jgi:hypothetical protein